MTEYVRVNVSTATSPVGAEDDSGDVVGEINMQLPANIIASADQVESARMAVMKANIPLSRIPQVVVSLRKGPDGTYRATEFFDEDPNYALRTNASIGMIIGYKDPFSAEIREYTNSSLNWKYLATPVVHFCTTEEEFKEANAKGYYVYSTIQEFLNDITNSLGFLFEAITSTSGDDPLLTTPYPPFIFRIFMKPDSTLSIVMYQYSASPEYVLSLHPSYFGDITNGWSNSFEMAMSYSRQWNVFRNITEVVKPIGSTTEVLGETWRLTDPEGPYQVNIVVNDYLRSKLPSLPWDKHIHHQFLYPEHLPSSVHAFKDDERLFPLRTEDAVFTFKPNAMTSIYRGGDYPDRNLPLSTSILEYDFPASDALQCCDVTSIILTMNGAAFNPQVYPVNFSPETVQAAQVQTIPIIDVFYPLWSTPTDLSTNMIVVRDAFNNAAPIKINPSLLKERSIKFKLYYITKDGRMHEMYIPRGSPFTFQLCFELTPRYPHA